MLDEHANFTEMTRLTQFCFLLQRSVYRWLSGGALISAFVTELASKIMVAMEGEPGDFRMGYSPRYDILHFAHKWLL